MKNLIAEKLAKKQYSRIVSNVPFVTLYTKYEGNIAKAVQLIDCEEDIKLSSQQLTAFCKRAEEYIRSKGYETVNILTIIVTSKVYEAKKFVIVNDSCWIFDTQMQRLLIFENQPDEFDGLRTEIEDIAGNPSVVRDEGVVTSGVAQRQTIRQRELYEEFTLVNTIMVLINVIVFFVMSYLGQTEDVDFMLSHGAMFAPSIIYDKEYYRFFTCMFQHFGFMHLVGNMVVLMFLGDNVERAVGKLKYVIIYVGSGLVGSLGSFLYAVLYNHSIVSAGASGAIFGLIGSLLWMVIKNKGRLENMTTLRICVLIAYALYNGFISENVDMAAHLFGLLGGFLIAILLYRKPATMR